MTENEGENGKKKPGPLRIALKVVLFTILAVLIWRLIHDRRADRQYRAAGKRIEELQQKNNSSPGKPRMGPAEVRETIGHDSVAGKPAAVDHYYREDYTWQRGLPWMQYYICVIYRDIDGEPKLFNAFQGFEPEDEALPVKPDADWERIEASIGPEKAAEITAAVENEGDQPGPSQTDEPTGEGQP